MKYKPSILFILIACLFLYVGCESSLSPEKAEADKKIKEAVSSSSESDRVNMQELEGKLKAGANVVKVAIQNSDFRNELYSLLRFYSEQENRFDAVSFAELESEEALHQKDKAYQSNITSTRINDILKDAFLKAESNGQNKAKSHHKFLVEDLANLYMPNLTIWNGKEIPTITWHPLDEEESSNKGYEPVLNSDKSKVTGWKKVTVDEEYGKENPVLIIMPGESFSYAPADMKAKVNENDDVAIFDMEIKPPPEDGGGGGGGGGDDPPAEEYYPPCDEGYCDESMDVLIGWVELNHYPCGWFCSGRRVYFSHQQAYQNFAGTPLTIETNRSSVYVPSDDRGSWQRYYTQFDSDWAPYQLSKPLSIYVGRGGGIDRLIEGAYKVISGGNLVDIVYDTYLDMTADDYSRDVFFDQALSRNTFENSNKSSYGHGTKDGYRIYRVDNQNGSNIRYTLPHYKH